VRLPRQAEQEIDPPSHAELRALERAIAPACRQAVATLDGAGLRVSELLPLGLALFVRELEQEVRAPFPPPVVVRATLAPLAWLARRRGRGARYAGRPATA